MPGLGLGCIKRHRTSSDHTLTLCWGEFLGLFSQCHTHTAENLAQSFKEGIAEGLNAEGVNAADALRLDQTALNAGNHSPDVAEGDAGEQEAPEQSDRDAEDGGQNAVAPIL